MGKKAVYDQADLDAFRARNRVDKTGDTSPQGS
jgi:hypothetical protein